MKHRNWIRESVPQLIAAAERGNSEAQVELSKRYLTGRDFVRSPKEGFNWASIAAERGNVDAIQILGHCYATGTGVQSSGRKAFDLFVKAALQGHQVALYNLAICYEYGIGTARDWHLAQKLYQKSADAGYAKAKHVLVARLWNKDTDDLSSSRRDTILAWYAAQANKGDELARKNLTLVRRNKRVRVEKDLQI